MQIVSGITIVGALISAGAQLNEYATILGGLAVMFAAINVVGGVSDKQDVDMFKKKKMISRGQNNEYRADQYFRHCGGLIYFWAQTAWVAGYGYGKYAFFFGDVDCRCSDSV